jgi:hypothetical protein
LVALVTGVLLQEIKEVVQQLQILVVAVAVEITLTAAMVVLVL